MLFISCIPLMHLMVYPIVICYTLRIHITKNNIALILKQEIIMKQITQFKYIYEHIWYIMVLCLIDILLFDKRIFAIDVFNDFSIIEEFSD